MTEPEPEKKTKKQLEQERIGHEEAVRLQEQLNEEETQRIARDAEIAKQFQEEYDRARQEQEIIAKEEQAYVIDWSDPAVLRYHALQNRPYSVAEVRKNMCIYLKNHRGFKMSHFKGVNYEEIRPIFERKEKEELKAYLDLVPREEFAMDFESLATTSRPEGYDLIWRLFDSCGIHILLMDNGIAIHMMIEKKYPLTQEMLSKMLSRKLEVDHENEMGRIVGNKSSQDSTASPREKINTAEDLRLLEEDCMKIKTCEKIYMDVI
ncbi:hypothetical protein Tco_1039383 [Tanacetum coccineum]